MKFVLLLIITIILFSCMSHKHHIGKKPNRQQQYMQENFSYYEAHRQFYTLFGLVPLYEPNINNSYKNFTIKTERGLADFFISFFTVGLLKSRTIKVFDNDVEVSPEFLSNWIRRDREHNKIIMDKARKMK